MNVFVKVLQKCIEMYTCYMNHTAILSTVVFSLNSTIQAAVLGMSLRKVTLLGSNLASVTDLKRIQTPHSLCWGFNFQRR